MTTEEKQAAESIQADHEPISGSETSPATPPEVSQDSPPNETTAVDDSPASETSVESATTAPVEALTPPPPAAASEPNPVPGTTPEQFAPAPSTPESTTVNSATASRIKEKLTAGSDHKPVGSDDGGSPRPETAGGPSVDIPDVGDLDESLEAQISSAMSADKSGPVDTAPVVMADMDDPEAAPVQEEIGPGSQLTGTVQQIHGEDVFVDAGLRGSIIVALKQFAEDKKPSVGDSLTVIVESTDADGLIRARLPQGRSSVGGNWDALAVGQVVDCMVTGTNKGGLQVSVSNLRGFMPASQVDTGYIDNLESFVGQKLTAQVTEVNKKKRNLVLSRRVLLQAERDGQRDEFWGTIEIGQEHEGTVKTIKDYGAFVNIGAMDGFLHIGEMSWSRINHPGEVLQEGQTVQVKILRKDDDKKRISLSMKQLIQNPWQSAGERYAAERIVSGTVSRIADFGAFVQLEPGIEGLAHISQLAWRRVGSVNEVLSMGETRDFQVIEVDTKRKRVSLSVKALEQRPEEPKRDESEPVPRKKSSHDLRGGTSGTEGAGGLFGNPSDFT